MQDSVARSGDLQIDDGRRVAGTSRFLVGRMELGDPPTTYNLESTYSLHCGSFLV